MAIFYRARGADALLKASQARFGEEAEVEASEINLRLFAQSFALKEKAIAFVIVLDFIHKRYVAVRHVGIAICAYIYPLFGNIQDEICAIKRQALKLARADLKAIGKVKFTSLTVGGVCHKLLDKLIFRAIGIVYYKVFCKQKTAHNLISF